MEKVPELINQLYQQGQTGLAILIAGLIIVILGGIWIIFLQRNTIKQFEALSSKNEQQIKLIESQIKAADSFRKERNEVQQNTVDSLNNQFDVVIKTNDELRKELTRINLKQDALKAKQNKLEQTVNKAITLGLEDIKDRITKISVQELMKEIPKEFRQDLESEVSIVSEKVLDNYVSKLKNSEFEIDHVVVGDFIEKSIMSNLHLFSNEFEDRFRNMINNFLIPTEYFENYYNDRRWKEYRERYVDLLAERIAYYLRGRY